MSTTISPATVAHIAQLANLNVNAQQQETFAAAFSSTLDEIARLSELDVSAVEPTHHVTGLTNVWREDILDEKRMFSQPQALSQAPHTLRGYIVVDRVLEESYDA